MTAKFVKPSIQRREHHDPDDGQQTYNVTVEIELKRVYAVRAWSKVRAENLAARLAAQEFPGAEFMTFDAEVAAK